MFWVTGCRRQRRDDRRAPARRPLPRPHQPRTDTRQPRPEPPHVPRGYVFSAYASTPDFQAQYALIMGAGVIAASDAIWSRWPRFAVSSGL
ncbi:hypothetical protein [Streptomyces bluensis]|uniref:hypothetical protein n=1 Tax=Streptomyces bluensis TaxID=33897 RepID=UPI003EB75B23